MQGLQRFCTKCGHQLEQDARFCAACGHAIADQSDRSVLPRSEQAPAARREPAAAMATEAGTASASQPSEQMAGPSPCSDKPPPPWRRRGMLAAVTAAVVVLAALAAAGWREHWPPALFGRANSPAPADAVRVVANLVSRSPAAVRDSLAAVYAAQVNSSVLAPAGTRIAVQPGTWQQHGTDASLRAVVTLPGRAPVTEVIYLVREEGQWRVLFTGAP